MPALITLENVPHAGDKIIVDLTDGNGVHEQFTYTVQAGDDLVDIRTQLILLISASSFFVAGFGGVDPEDPIIFVNQVTNNNFYLFTCVVSFDYDPANVSPAYTMAFDENNNAFEGERAYQPEWMSCLGVLMINFKNGSPYSHDSPVFNNFFGVQYPSNITGVANQGLFQKKTFISLNEIANTTWGCPLIYTSMYSYKTQRQESRLDLSMFKVLEGQPSASFRRDIFSQKGIINGDSLKGSWIAIKFEVDNSRTTDLVALSAASVKFIDSPLNNK